LAPLFSTIIAGVDPLCDTNGHEERTKKLKCKREEIEDPEHFFYSITNLYAVKKASEAG